MKLKDIEVELLKGDIEHLQNNINSMLKLFKERPQRRKKRLEQFNGTTIHTFFYMITENEWYDTSNCVFNITIDGGEKEQELTIKEIKETYNDYYVCDYDLTHEIKNDQYEITGWIDLYKDDAQVIIQEQFEQIERQNQYIQDLKDTLQIKTMEDVITKVKDLDNNE